MRNVFRKYTDANEREILGILLTHLEVGKLREALWSICLQRSIAWRMAIWVRIIFPQSPNSLNVQNILREYKEPPVSKKLILKRVRVTWRTHNLVRARCSVLNLIKFSTMKLKAKLLWNLLINLRWKHSKLIPFSAFFLFGGKLLIVY